MHVAIGRDDAYVSREHATLRCVPYGGATQWVLRQRGSVRPDTKTGTLRLPLTQREWLVLVAMFSDVLAREDQALARTWHETARLLNTVPGQSGWTDRTAENVVDGVRQRLTAAGIDRLTRETAPSEALETNLARVLIDTGTLLPEDLRVLQTGIGNTENQWQEARGSSRSWPASC